MHKIFYMIAGLLFSWQLHAAGEVINKDASPLKLQTAIKNTDNLNPTVSQDLAAQLLSVNADGQLVSVLDSLWLQADYSAQYQAVRLDDTADTQTDFYSQLGAKLLARLYLSDDLFVDASVGYKQEDEMLGTGLSKLKKNILQADEKKQDTASVSLIYGKQTSARHISLSYTQLNTDYAAINPYSDLFDLSQQTIGINVKFRMSSATRFITFMEHQQDDYALSVRADSTMQRAMLGFDWKPSGSATLTLLVGQYQRKTEDDNKTDGLTWRVGYQYMPRDDFQISLLSSQSSVAGESELASDSLLQEWKIAGQYHYSQQWQYGASVTLAKTEYQESTGTRDLNENIAAVWIGLKLSHANKVQLQYGYRSARESNDLVDYQQNEVGLSWHYEF